MTEVEMVPGITLVCMVPDGRGRRHNKPIGVVQLIDGEIDGVMLGRTRRGDDGKVWGDVRGPVWPGEHDPSGQRTIMAHCPEHGLLIVAEDEVRSSLAKRPRGPRGLHVTHHAPLKRRSHKPAER